jgi:hypothetical protein
MSKKNVNETLTTTKISENIVTLEQKKKKKGKIKEKHAAAEME